MTDCGDDTRASAFSSISELSKVSDKPLADHSETIEANMHEEVSNKPLADHSETIQAKPVVHNCLYTDHQQVQSVTGQPAPIFNHDTVRPFLGSPMQECPKTMMLTSAATVIKTVMAMVRKRMNLMNTMTMVTVIVWMTAEVMTPKQ